MAALLDDIIAHPGLIVLYPALLCFALLCVCMAGEWIYNEITHHD